MKMSQSSTQARAARTIWPLLATGVVLLLLLAGCAPGATSASTQTAAQTSSTAATISPTATTTYTGSPVPTTTPPSGSAQTGCPEPTQNVKWPSPPIVVVTLPQSTPVQAKVGDTLEIVLTWNQKWALVSHNDAILRLDNPSGYGDASLHSCVWHFTALTNGQEDVVFSGGPPCAKGAICPAPVGLVDLTIQVSSN